VTTVVANVASGVVDAGIVYSTDAKANTGISSLPIAQRNQPATVYAVAVTKQARAATAAQEFVAFLLSAQGQSLLHAAGFGSPTPCTSPPPPAWRPGSPPLAWWSPPPARSPPPSSPCR